MTLSSGQPFDEARVTAERPSLRDALRAATAGEYAALDHAMLGLDFEVRADLLRFLGIQLAARAGVERWLAEHCPPGWGPPPQTGLIADDLIALGGFPSVFPAPRFDPDPAVDWIGSAYVTAASHLGNRLMLAQAGASLPWEARRFLTASAMQDYWRRLRTLVSEPPGPRGTEDAVAAARATIAHFRDCVDHFSELRPAAA